ncbi:unnamed protein product [Hymenolepis diminuta]|uniref:Uncharacterized protein n=1 Tax=Hymenolepis diminuta TaxID=6216 RepID=A0A564XU56_HYMDI|nr:unnamed protein product [Hymenolepis diminuta]
MEENLNVKLKEIVRGVKIANLTSDSALTGSVCISALFSTICDNRILLSNINRLYLVSVAEVGIFLNNVLSISIGVNNGERWDKKKTIASDLTEYSRFIYRHGHD